MNPVDFSNAVLNGVPLLAVIMGLVEFSKKFGAKDLVCDALSLGLGVVFGLLYQLSTAGLPVDLAGWFGTFEACARTWLATSKLRRRTTSGPAS